MLRIEVQANKDNTALKNKIKSKNANTLEAIYMMAVAYDLIKDNDEVGITDKEIMNSVKDLCKQFNKNRKENK